MRAAPNEGPRLSGAQPGSRLARVFGSRRLLWRRSVALDADGQPLATERATATPVVATTVRGGKTMTTKETDTRATEDPEGRLEQALIEEFLRARGLDSNAVHALPEDEAKRVLTEASSVCRGETGRGRGPGEFRP